MSPTSEAKGPDWPHLARAVDGLALGSWLVGSQIQEARKGRAELDGPEGAEEVREDVLVQ